MMPSKGDERMLKHAEQVRGRIEQDVQVIRDFAGQLEQVADDLARRHITPDQAKVRWLGIRFLLVESVKVATGR